MATISELLKCWNLQTDDRFLAFVNAKLGFGAALADDAIVAYLTGLPEFARLWDEYCQKAVQYLKSPTGHFRADAQETMEAFLRALNDATGDARFDLYLKRAIEATQMPAEGEN